MKVLVSGHTAMALTPDGRAWTVHPMGYEFWKRYLEVFDEVHLFARTRMVSRPPGGLLRVTGPGVHLVAAPDFQGVWQWTKRLPALKRAARKAVANAEAMIVRLPQPLSQVVWDSVEPGRPYGVEVTSDPHDGFAPGALRHPLRPVMRWWFSRRLRMQCARACGVSYATAGALQKRYPVRAGALSTHYSNVSLDEAAWVRAPRSAPLEPGRFRLILVGAMHEMFKAPDVLIDAVALCVEEGLDLRVEFVGGGRHLAEMVARAAARGLEDRACFRGLLNSAEAVRERLDQADLFVMPSRVEGLPRAMIEAMARGLPCIGSTVGG
ncbi:MAG: glycosyltransferase family 4 protein, partial [bacterium]|nr:glycosyltransferase family 4 protein [bacterium]